MPVESRHIRGRPRVLIALAALLAAGCAGVRELPEAPAIQAGDRTDWIESGRYLAYGPAHCVACHTPDGPRTELAEGKLPPLSGGYSFRFPGISVWAPNLTPDSATGIGRHTDAELVRVLRHGVLRDGRRAVPLMAYQDMSDGDLRALLSFLRSQPAVSRPVPRRRLSFMGRMGMALFVRSPQPRGRPPAAGPPESPTVERGEYLANTVAQCVDCHTQRSFRGKLKGPRFAGGMRIPVPDNRDLVFVTPNLTPDPKTGVMFEWSEDQFLDRFRAGRILPGSEMPWPSYARMTESDLRAIYRYLHTLEPVRRATGPSLQEK